MAIAFGNAADLGDNGGTTNSRTTFYVNNGANRLLILNIITDFAGSGGGSFDDITSVTYAGVSLTFIAKVVNLSGTPVVSARFSYLYAGYNLPTGSNNFVVTCTNTHFILMVCADYTGTGGNLSDNSTTQDATAAGETLTTLTTTLSTIADNCWLALSLAFDTAGSTVTPTGVALRIQGGTFGIPNLYDSNGAVTSAGNHSVTTAFSPGAEAEIAHILMSFAPPQLPYDPWPLRAPLLAQ